MKRIVCPNCELQINPDPIKHCGAAWPLEAMVAEDDAYRQEQYEAAIAGQQYRHSLNMAAGHPLIGGLS